MDDGRSSRGTGGRCKRGYSRLVGRRVDIDLVVTAADIGGRAGVSAQAVHNWRHRYEDFPVPLRVIGNYQVWYWPEVERWLAANTAG